jgi:hypothetical protein
MQLKIYDDSKNYTAQIVRLPSKITLQGLDNLVGVSVQGQLCLIQKDYPDGLYLFVPAGTVLSSELLRGNNLYRNESLNHDQTKKGYIEPTGRVKALKLKGVVSTGLILKLDTLKVMGIDPAKLTEGQEFNEIDGKYFCRKYIVFVKGSGSNKQKVGKILDDIIDSRLFPEHMDTKQLLKYLGHLDLNDEIVITTKLHGTSARVGITLTNRKLSLLERLAKWFGIKVQEEEYQYVVGSHHVIKSVNFETFKGKNHFYAEDLWTKCGEEYFRGKLAEGELVYYEIIGKDYTGKEIQKNYSYGFTKPKIYVYRISQINAKGREVDLSWRQVKARCNELGVDYVPEIYSGKLCDYDFPSYISSEWREDLEKYLVKTFLDKPSIFDKNVIEEGICIRKETYPRPHIYKLKAPLFYLHETKLADQGVEDIEEQS